MNKYIQAITEGFSQEKLFDNYDDFRWFREDYHKLLKSLEEAEVIIVNISDEKDGFGLYKMKLYAMIINDMDGDRQVLMKRLDNFYMAKIIGTEWDCGFYVRSKYDEIVRLDSSYMIPLMNDLLVRLDDLACRTLKIQYL